MNNQLTPTQRVEAFRDKCAHRSANNISDSLADDLSEAIRLLGRQATELEAAQQSLQMAIAECNKYGGIIVAMSDALGPVIGESNVDCANRVSAELAKLRQLAAAFEAAQKEHGKVTDEPNANGSTNARLNWWKDKCDNLQERLTALEADKARLDWLEDWRKCYHYHIQLQPSGKVLADGYGPHLRLAIDSAMSAQKEGK